jgi:Tol biopolymer transport system component
MGLRAGDRIGPYEVVSLLGAGGMGEVYRARDRRLNRDIALKVLPEAFIDRPDRLARFEREAQLLAALNHPNIAAIYGLEEQSAPDPASTPVRIHALVMEFVDGPTLADRIAPGPIALDEALPIAKQLADALEAAHDQGIIHRDLKPANIKVRADGTVKVLDFGLAKALDSGSSQLETANSPTITSPAMTRAGLIVGTAGYMAPEQARGKPIDRRADIWAFGVVLHEMLTGRSLFGGETVTDVLAAVVGREIDWNDLPATTPARVRRLLQRCLVRDSRVRMRDMGEARIALDEIITTPEPRIASDGGSVVAATGTGWRTTAMWAAASLLVGVLAFLAGSSWHTPPSELRTPLRAGIGGGVPLWFGMRPALAMAPDGSYVVLVGERNGETQLYKRSLADETAVPIDGTRDGTGPFFSPDGRWVGFFAEGQLKKVPSEGGTTTVVAPAALGQGGAFAPDGSIVFAPVHGEGLLKVGPAGGPAQVVTTVDRAHGEAGHHWPQMLPDGQHLLMTVEVKGKPYSDARIVLVSLESKDQRVLVDGGSDAQYVPTGHLVYWQAGDLWAAPFDVKTFTITGPRFLAVRGVMAAEPNGFAQYSFSRDGRLVFLEGRDPLGERSLVLVDRSGNVQTLTTDQRAFERPRVSPDGKFLAVSVAAANDSVWVEDFERKTLTRLTFDDENRRAVWSPDSTRLAFLSNPGGTVHQIVVAPLDGSTAPEVVHTADRPEQPECWSAAGDLLVFTRSEPDTLSDIWVLPMSGERRPKPLLNSRFDESEARVSSDGRWLAYQSDESGKAEIYMRPFPGPGGKRQVSTDGGVQPRWRRDGRELYFRREAAVMGVSVSVDGSVSVPLKIGSGPPTENRDFAWDLMPDGQRFIMVDDHAQMRTSVSLMLGWFDDLRRLAR